MYTNIDPELGPIHPGEILLEEFLIPMGVTQYRLAKATGVDPRRINEIVHGRRGISADTALRLGLFFGVEPQMWLNLQARYDLELAAQQHGSSIQEQVIPWQATGT
ncbi:MAG: HigA family addiction module antidote protein [Oligoflexia bacterium]|nr:HigA family addiction module antidote protein [Oligoflexia bacterium]